MIPKRAIGALLTTALGLILLLSFKTAPSPDLATAGSKLAVVGQPSTTSAPEMGQATTDGGAGTTQNGTAQNGTSSGAYADGTFTGSVISTRYGDVQVQVTTSGGAISDVTTLSLPDRDGHSARISQSAEPLLREEALTAQSAQIDLLSGATYTSEGYVESLQSALDQAHA
jgi:uncharacterized protein with FMN-binding domain